MGGGDLGDDGEPEAGPGTPGRGARAVEPVEDAGEPVGRDAGTVVADLHDDAVAGLAGGDDGGGPFRGVRVHVGQQVVHGPAQQFLVADGDEPGGDAGLPASPRIGDPGPLDAAGGQRADIGSGPGYGQPPRLVQVACPLPRQFHKGHFNFKITVKDRAFLKAHRLGKPVRLRIICPNIPAKPFTKVWAAGSPLRHGRGEQHAHRGLRPGPGSAA